jgi:hypothetical protein
LPLLIIKEMVASWVPQMMQEAYEELIKRSTIF